MINHCVECGERNPPMVLVEQGVMCISCLATKCSDDLKKQISELMKTIFAGPEFIKLASTFAESFENLDYEKFARGLWIHLKPNIISLFKEYGIE